MNEDDVLNKIRESLKDLLYITPVGVTFYFDENMDLDSERPNEPLRFCQAVNRVLKASRSMLLKKEDVSCHAARAVLGFENDTHVM